MAYSYTPTYYSSLHDSITSICKNILPFSFKKKRLPAIAAAEQRLAKQQSDNLKWQQESFHQILNLMGLCKEGILHENEVSAFRAHLLETLVALPLDYEAPVIVRDKLIFLQELLYTKCISEDEYHKSKMPLLQMLAVQGAEIRERDVVAAPHKQILNEEWPVTDLNLKEKKGLINSENLVQRNKLKEGSTTKKINGTSSTSDLVLRHNNGKLKEDNKDASDPGAYDVRPGNRNISTTSVSRNELITSTENPFWNNHVDEKESESKSILVMETLTEASVKAEQTGSAKGKRKPFRALFQRDQKAGQGDCGNERDPAIEEKEKVKPVKKTWGFDGFRKWKKSDIEDETAPLSLIEKSDGANPVETKQMKKELHPHGLMADTFPDKVLREDIKEQSRIQTELSARTAHFHLLGDHNEEISTRPPVDNADPKKIFQKSWSNQHGDSKLDVIEKELKVGKDDGELGNSPGLGREKHNSKRWTTFDDEENSHPNLFAPQASHSWSRNARTSFNSSSSSSIDKGFRYNPFFDM